MTLYLYSLKNRLSGCYERPVAEIYEPAEYLESLNASLAVAEVPQLNFYKQFDVYCLGTFESKTGAIVPMIDFVGTLEPICEPYIMAKGDKNGREEESRSA